VKMSFGFSAIAAPVQPLKREIHAYNRKHHLGRGGEQELRLRTVRTVPLVWSRPGNQKSQQVFSVKARQSSDRGEKPPKINPFVGSMIGAAEFDRTR
jgi:hypothetical protein